MKRHRHSPEQALHKVREGERLLSEGTELIEVLRHLEIPETLWVPRTCGCQNPIHSLSWCFSQGPIPAGRHPLVARNLRGVLASVLYLLVRRVLALTTLKFRSRASKDLEIVVLPWVPEMSSAASGLGFPRLLCRYNNVGNREQ